MLARIVLAVALVSSSTVRLAAAEVRGVVSKVDLDKKELLLEGRGKGLRGQFVLIHFTPETRFEAGRQAAQPSDLTPGRRVRVLYESRDGVRQATLVSWLGLFANTPPPGPAAALDPNTVAGTLERIALTEREITVVGPAAGGPEPTETTLSVPNDVVIQRDQKPVQLSDLKEGEQATVRFETRDGKRVARVITAGVAPAPGTPQRGERIGEIMKLIEGLLQQLRERR
jgi:hypothetical protein